MGGDTSLRLAEARGQSSITSATADTDQLSRPRATRGCPSRPQGPSPTGRCPWQGSSTPASGEPSGPQGKQPRPAPLRTPALQGDQDCLPGRAQGRHSLECRLTDASLPVSPPQVPCQSEAAGSPQSGRSSTRFPRACGRRPAGPGEGSARPRPLWCPGFPPPRRCGQGHPGSRGPADPPQCPIPTGAGFPLSPLTARLGCTTPSFPVRPRSTVRPRESRSLWPTVSMMVLTLPRLSSLQRAQAL